MPRILIAGSSGFIGGAAKKHFTRAGWQVVSLVRRAPTSTNEIFWNPDLQELNFEEIESFDVILNLAGTNIAKGLWTNSRKKQILNSRVWSSELLAKSIQQLKNPPKFFISASAIGIYKTDDRNFVVNNEEAETGYDFLATVCKAWEKAAQLGENQKTKQVSLRFGIVLGKDGGLLKQLIPTFKFGLGATLGDGQQQMSWIALSDLLSAIDWIISKELSGVFNLTSPNSYSNAEFSRSLANYFGKSLRFKIPIWILRLLGTELADRFLLANQRAYPKALLASGFGFNYADLSAALSKELAEDTTGR